MTSSTALIILFLAANPKGTSQLDLAQEVRSISEELLRSQYRDRFKLEQRWAVRPRDVQRALLDLNPQIVHFSGHGVGRPELVLESQQTISQSSRNIAVEQESEEGLVFESDDGSIALVSGNTLANLFKLFSDKVRCVLLNGCYTEIQAEAIVQHIPYVIGMKKGISDQAAIDFAIGFYDALAAGHSIEFAHAFGCNTIEMAGISEYLTPVLKKNPKLDAVASQNILVESDKSSLGKKRLLQGKREDLEETYEELRKKLRRLQKDYIIEADSEAKYKLEQRTEEYKLKLQQIEEELDNLENE